MRGAAFLSVTTFADVTLRAQRLNRRKKAWTCQHCRRQADTVSDIHHRPDCELARRHAAQPAFDGY